MIRYNYSTNFPIQIGPISQQRTDDGQVLGFEVECFHAGLGDRQVVSNRDQFVLVRKVHALIKRWNFRWQKCSDEKASAELSLEIADKIAKSRIRECESILAAVSSFDCTSRWFLLQDEPEFKWEHNRLEGVSYDEDTGEPESIKTLPALPPPPEWKFAPKLTFADRIFSSKKQAKVAEAQEGFSRAMDDYERRQSERERHNHVLEKNFREERASFEADRKEYLSKQLETNSKVEALEKAWLASEPHAVVEHADLVLRDLDFPATINTFHKLDYLQDSRTLAVNFLLPRQEQIPLVESVSYVKARREVREKHLTSVKAARLYENVCYQIALRSIHAVLVTDHPGAISAVVFNGHVDAVNRATGISNCTCILSVRAERDEFLELDLNYVDAKACFLALKGVAASSLAELVPIRPVLHLNRVDPRFVDSYSMADKLDERFNLAAMPWEDFEHLVRELFSKIFSGPGSEVKVTQASRDGGVDAIVLDPDPIKGGKIIIQAKRYTDTVGVSAVRDLYGTVINEGANRGILITTSGFGGDAFRFANGKPLTLLDGSNLLALLAEHGHEAKIDLAEARRLRGV